MRSAAGLVAGPFVVLLLVGACGASVAPSAPAPTPVTAPASSPAPASLPPSPTSATSPTSPSPAASPAPATSPDHVAVEDLALLDVLPEAVGGAPLIVEDGQFEAALADPDFAASVEAAAFGTFVAGEDLASAAVVRPAPGVFDPGWFRDWRDSYNAGACGQAGGVARTAEAEIDGRTVHIATCAGGLRVYHAWIEDAGLLVSAFALGEGRFGEQVMAGLRP